MKTISFQRVLWAVVALSVSWCWAMCSDTVAQEELLTTAIVADDPGLPNGYVMAAYLDCGTQERGSGESGLAIKQTAGTPYAFPQVGGAIGTAAVDEQQVVFEVTGLKTDREYVLGFTWWDADDKGRVQSVRFGTEQAEEWVTVLPAGAPAAFYKDESTWARVLLPVTMPFRKDGWLRVAFVNEEGPDAVVSELWLLEQRTAVQKRVLVVTGEDYGGHLWRETAPELARILREDARLEVAINEAPVMLGSPLLDHYDAVLIHFKNYAERMPLGAAIGAGLERYVAAGKGLVISHFGCGAFQEWDGYVQVVGRVWNPDMRPHDPRGEFDVTITDPAHPITRGMTDFRADDELYTCLDGTPPIHVLCQAVSKVDNLPYAIGFTTGPPESRIFHCTLGHDVQALQPASVRELFRRAATWAAGLPPVP